MPAAPVLEETVEPLRPLIQEARWTSSLVAEQLLADSEAFYTEWSPLHAQPPYAVYHYTDTAGLKGILESGHLRAADVTYLDDSREIGYAYGLMREHLRKRWRSNDQLVGDFCLQAELALDPRRWTRNLFIACFCENGDALTQWRTHGTDGAYAIGLRTGALDSVGVRLQRAELRRVVYSAEQQNALLQHCWIAAVNVVRAAHGLARAGACRRRRCRSSSSSPITSSSWWRASSARTCRKSSSGVWPLRSIRSMPASARGRCSSLRAMAIRCRMSISMFLRAAAGRTSPVAEVVCGPIERSDLAARSIQLLLKSRGNASARIRHSRPHCGRLTMNVSELFSLKDRVALITGGSRGLGLQIAEALGEVGRARRADRAQAERAR